MKSIIITTILTALCLTSNAVNNDTIISLQDEKVIALTDIWSLDQGVRSDINLYCKLPNEFLHKIDSISIDYIRRFGFDTQLSKYYKDKYKHLSSAIYAVLLHNPHRLFEPEIYALLKNEMREKRIKYHNIPL